MPQIEDHLNTSHLINEAYSSCATQAKNHYENFPIILSVFPSHIKQYLVAIYAFARTGDDIADELQLSREIRLANLLAYEQQLYSCYDGVPQTPLFIALQHTIQACRLPVEPFLSLLVAFKMDILFEPIETLNQLRIYSQYSANPFGRLILNVHGISDAKSIAYSDAICTGLQWVNFLQDVNLDLEKNRIYLPREVLKKFHINDAVVSSRKNNPQLSRAIAYMAEQTQQLFDEGKPLLKAVTDRHLRHYLKCVWLGGTEVLRMLKQHDYDVFSKRLTLSKLTKLKLYFKAHLF